jgi:hypothetical protein
MQNEFSALRAAIQQTTTESVNSLAATIGEVEDKLDRALAARQ